MIINRRFVLKHPIVIAEAGNNHEGSLDAALELLIKAKESGADMVKFQAGNAEGFARTKEDILRYKKYELGRKGYDRLVKEANKLNYPILFSVWSDEFNYLRDMENYKIAARQCTQEFVSKYDRDGVFVSIPHTYVTHLKIEKAIPMHCVSEYPAKDSMLERIGLLRDRYSGLVGYSDHTIGVGECLRAIRIYHADVIEKHFTLAHDFGELRDHRLSATPEEMKILVEGAKCENINCR